MRTLDGGYFLVVSALWIALSVLIGVVIGAFWPDTWRRDPAQSTAQPLDGLTDAIQAVDERLDTVERATDSLRVSESTRDAMIAESLDKFSRLYKRMAERQSREDRAESTPELELNPEYLRRLKVR